MADEPKNTKPPMPEEKKSSGDAKKEEKAPETKAEAKPAAAAGAAASAWIPVLAVMIVLPVLSFVMTEMVMIPRVKKALGEIATIQQEAAHPAHGGAAPTEKKAAKKEAKGGLGKEGGEADAGKEVKFDNVVANLTGSMKTRFVKVSFSIEGEAEDFKDVIKDNKTKLIDSALSVLGSLTVAELDEPGMKNIVRSDLLNAFNQVLGKPIVTGLYFSEFVIQ